MLPFIYENEELPFALGDWIFVPKIKEAIEKGETNFKAYVVKPVGSDEVEIKEFELKMGALTDDEKEIVLKGCLINYYKN